MALHIAHTTTGLGSPHYSYFIEEWVYDFITMTAALAVLARAALRREQRLPWALIGAGLLLWAASDLYWTTLLNSLSEPPFPSAADVGYLVGDLCVIAGIATYVRSRVTHMSAIVWTDVAIGALCIGAIGASLLMDFVLANTTGTPLEIGVAVAYPLLDLVALAVAVGAVALTGWRPGRALGLVAAGVACAAAGDAVYTYQSLAGTYDGSAWNNSLWPLATLLIAAGALAPSPKRRESGLPEGWRAFASPTVFAIAVLALLMLERQDIAEPAVAALTGATLAAVVLRLGLTFAENRRLVGELESDPLTGLANRSRLLYDLDRLFAADDPAPHVLTTLDLDGFKAYNDAFGHPAGDALLIRLGRQLGEAVSGKGRAYRLGGDEFAMLFDGDRATNAHSINEGAAALTEQGVGFKVSSSSGSVDLPVEATGPGSALQLADQRMYAQKDSRRPSAGGEVEAVLLRIVQQRTPELGDHGNAVAKLAAAVGRELGLTPGELNAMGRAAELHDIGKMAIPDAILQKQGALSDEEWEFMRQHTILGERIVGAAPSLGSVSKLIRSTHERWDGDGYPDGLAKTAIPHAARIIFACDAYDAMTNDRPYAPGRSSADALREMQTCAGTQFDPKVVEALVNVVRSGVEEKRAPGEQPVELTPQPAPDTSRSPTSSV